MTGGSVSWSEPKKSTENLVRSFPLAYRKHSNLVMTVEAVVGDQTRAHWKLAESIGDCLRIRKESGEEFLVLYEALLNGCFEATDLESRHIWDVMRAVGLGTIGYLAWVLSENEVRSGADVWDPCSGVGLTHWSAGRSDVSVHPLKKKKTCARVFLDLLPIFIEPVFVENLSLASWAPKVAGTVPVRLGDSWNRERVSFYGHNL